MFLELNKSTRIVSVNFVLVPIAAWKVSVLGVCLVHIFSHLDWIYGEIRYGTFRIQSECGKIQTRKTPNMNTFYTVNIVNFEYILGILLIPLLWTLQMFLMGRYNLDKFAPIVTLRLRASNDAFKKLALQILINPQKNVSDSHPAAFCKLTFCW